MNQKQVVTLFKLLQKSIPNPKSELNFSSPFELLVAVMLSQQATDISVNKVTDKLFKVANTPKKIIELGVDGLRELIKTIGLHNQKAKNIHQSSIIILQKHEGKIPNTRDSLETLPGVGRKTANIILNTIFHQPTIAVDTHIFRFANRVGLVSAKTPLATEKTLMQIVPKEFMQDAHHLLLLHGRYVCKARKPKCDECVLRDLCEFYHGGGGGN
ncbi:MAG: endonuclease III [Gammaproteobacteria bacterium]|nr:endonuclease III [Gammaproteobacteria bacterium]